MFQNMDKPKLMFEPVFVNLVSGCVREKTYQICKIVSVLLSDHPEMFAYPPNCLL